MDLTNETFTNALEHLGGFQWRGVTFGAWLYRIAMNLSRKHERETVRNRDIERIPEEALGVDDDDTLQAMVTEENRRFLSKCLDSLDEQSRNVFILHYWSGLTIREISVVMDVKEGTLRSKLKRDREKIRRMYGNRTIDYDI